DDEDVGLLGGHGPNSLRRSPCPPIQARPLPARERARIAADCGARLRLRRIRRGRLASKLAAPLTAALGSDSVGSERPRQAQIAAGRESENVSGGSGRLSASPRATRAVVQATAHASSRSSATYP